MDKGLASVVPRIPPPRKAAARAALVDVKEPARAILAECFRQFGIETVPLTIEAADRILKEKFEACVVKLDPSAQGLMEAARSSPSNTRMVIYGLGGTVQDAMQFSKYGINAVFNEPVERPTALKLVRATQMLVLHEFRRYVRVPVITEVSMVSADGRRFTATSKEISSGGMSLKSSEDLGIGAAVEVSFALLTLPRIWVKGVVAWKSKNILGVRFDTQDNRRLRIKEWVEAYLES
jgi:PilZ domain